MSYTIISCEQSTPEWFAARCGLTTASMFSTAVSTISTLSDQQRIYFNAIQAGKDLLEAKELAGYKATPKSASLTAALNGEPTTRISDAAISYCDELAFERISGAPYGDTYQTQAMKRGSEEEMWARARYEELYDCEIIESGIALTEDRRFGYSTDGAVRGKRGGIEIKTPASAAKLRAMVESLDLSEYEHQVQGGMWIRGWEWVDNIIWMPHLKNVRNEMLVKRVYRDDDFIEKLEMDLLAFDARIVEAIAFWSTPFRRDGLPGSIVTDLVAKTPVAPQAPALSASTAANQFDALLAA